MPFSRYLEKPCCLLYLLYESIIYRHGHLKSHVSPRVNHLPHRPNPAPALTPTPFLLPRAIPSPTCNAVNCYHAANSIIEDYRNYYSGSRTPLCSSYTSSSTVVTSLTKSPSNGLPSSCFARRITSLCDCLVPAKPCKMRAFAPRIYDLIIEEPSSSGIGWMIDDTADTWTLGNDSQAAYQGNNGL